MSACVWTVVLALYRAFDTIDYAMLLSFSLTSQNMRSCELNHIFKFKCSVEIKKLDKKRIISPLPHTPETALLVLRPLQSLNMNSQYTKS